MNDLFSERKKCSGVKKFDFYNFSVLWINSLSNKPPRGSFLGVVKVREVGIPV